MEFSGNLPGRPSIEYYRQKYKFSNVSNCVNFYILLVLGGLNSIYRKGHDREFQEIIAKCADSSEFDVVIFQEQVLLSSLSEYIWTNLV